MNGAKIPVYCTIFNGYVNESAEYCDIKITQRQCEYCVKGAI